MLLKALTVYILCPSALTFSHAHDSSSDSDDITVQTPLLDVSSGLAPPTSGITAPKPRPAEATNISQFDKLFGNEEDEEKDKRKEGLYRDL